MERRSLAIKVLWALALSAGACGGGSSPDADAGLGEDGGKDRDAAPGEVDAQPLTSGLILTYEPEPAFPVTIGGTYQVELSRSVRLELRDVRIIGDSASGDPRTSREEIELAWGCEKEEEEGEDECEPGTAPTRFEFPEAPEGIYSSLLARFHEFRYEGQATTDVTRDFTVEEELENVDLTIPLPDIALGRDVIEIVITVDLDDPMLAVDWGMVEPDGSGILLVNEASPQIDSIIEEAAEAFRFSGVR